MESYEHLQLLGPRLLVQMDPEPTTFGSGILVKPDTVYEDSNIEGTVLKVGTGFYISKAPGIKPLDINVGDKVCFVKFHDRTVENPQIQSLLGKGIIIIKYQDVLYVRRSDEKGKD